MIKFFRRRSPKHRAAPPVYKGYRVSASRPEFCSPCIDLYGYEAVVSQAEDVRVAEAWGMTQSQWWYLSDFERAECRRNFVTAPKFGIVP